MKYYTTIKQSKKLLELGLNPESSDMAHIIKRNDCRESWELAAEDPGNVYTDLKDSVAMCLSDYALPSWSLGALLEVMPRIILNEYDMYGWDLYPAAKNFRLSYIKYGNVNAPDYQEIVFYEINEKTLIEAAYSMVVWLLENGYIKKGTKDF